MKYTGKYITDIIVFILISLWVYAALSKWLDYSYFKWQIRNQVLSPILIETVIRSLIPGELILALLLVIKRTRLFGLICSAVVMAIFSAYIGLVLLHVFNRTPCSCGGILEKMGWTTHFVFNLSILTLTLISIITYNRKEVAS